MRLTIGRIKNKIQLAGWPQLAKMHFDQLNKQKYSMLYVVGQLATGGVAERIYNGSEKTTET